MDANLTKEMEIHNLIRYLIFLDANTIIGVMQINIAEAPGYDGTGNDLDQMSRKAR